MKMRKISLVGAEDIVKPWLVTPSWMFVAGPPGLPRTQQDHETCSFQNLSKTSLGPQLVERDSAMGPNWASREADRFCSGRTN